MNEPRSVSDLTWTMYRTGEVEGYEEVGVAMSYLFAWLSRLCGRLMDNMTWKVDAAGWESTTTWNPATG